MREIVPARFDPWVKHPTATKVLLDPAGRAVAHRPDQFLPDRPRAGPAALLPRIRG